MFSSGPFPIGVDNNPLVKSIWQAESSIISNHPSPPEDNLITEDGQFLTTENGLNITTE